MARQRYRSVRRIFLADGDALIRKASELYTILDTIRELFPGVRAGHQLRLSQQHPPADGRGAANPPG